MKLEDYLKKHDLSQVRFSSLVKTHPVHINRLIKGLHLPSIPLVKKIERATNGEVTFKDFCTNDE